MNFTIKDRLILLRILPNSGSLSEMVDLMDLAKNLKLSDEEKADISYKEDGKGTITWDVTKEPNKQFDLTSDQVKLLKNAVKKLDEEKQITLYTVETMLKIQNL